MINFEYLKNLNSEQKNAVIHTNGPILIVAGAGSGKTKVLTAKIAYIIKEKIPILWLYLKLKFIFFMKF